MDPARALARFWTERMSNISDEQATKFTQYVEGLMKRGRREGWVLIPFGPENNLIDALEYAGFHIRELVAYNSYGWNAKSTWMGLSTPAERLYIGAMNDC